MKNLLKYFKNYIICFFILAKGHFEIIVVNANKSELSMDDLSALKVYVTSNNNADGIYLSYYLDGDTLEFELKVMVH